MKASGARHHRNPRHSRRHLLGRQSCQGTEGQSAFSAEAAGGACPMASGPSNQAQAKIRAVGERDMATFKTGSFSESAVAVPPASSAPSRPSSPVGIGFLGIPVTTRMTQTRITDVGVRLVLIDESPRPYHHRRPNRRPTASSNDCPRHRLRWQSTSPTQPSPAYSPAPPGTMNSPRFIVPGQ